MFAYFKKKITTADKNIMLTQVYRETCRFFGTFVCFNICTVCSPEHIKLITNFRPGVRRISGVTEAAIWVRYSEF